MHIIAAIKTVLRYAGLVAPPPTAPPVRAVSETEHAGALLATAVGLIAGFVATGLIMGTTQLLHGELLRFSWHAALALLLASTTFGRMRTHFALRPPVPYDVLLLCCDVWLVVAASVALAIVDSPLFPSQPFWLATVAVAGALFARDVRLNVAYAHQVRVAQRFLALGILFALYFAFRTPEARNPARVFVVLFAASTLVQLVLETLGRPRPASGPDPGAA